MSDLENLKTMKLDGEVVAVAVEVAIIGVDDEDGHGTGGCWGTGCLRLTSFQLKLHGEQEQHRIIRLEYCQLQLSERLASWPEGG